MTESTGPEKPSRLLLVCFGFAGVFVLAVVSGMSAFDHASPNKFFSVEGRLHQAKVAFQRVSDVRYWHKADIALPLKNACFGGKADIAIDGPECPLMTQSRHRA
jgi:hypothetical protein